MNAMQLAEAMHAALITDKRPDDSTFVRLADDSPDWMRDLVREAHDGMMPNDMKYIMISEVLFAMTEREGPETWDEFRNEIVDGLVDIYNHKRVEWLASHLERAYYCDEALEEYNKPSGIYELLGWGQYREYDEIFGIVMNGLVDRAGEQEEPEDA